MRFVTILVLLLMFAGNATHAQKLGEKRLVVNGKAQVTVVLPDGASEIVRAAAHDLVHCLGKALGAEVPLVDTSAAVKTPLSIVIGMRAGVDVSGLSRDGCLLKTEGDHLLLTGATDVGVANGVYTFLIETVGVRWFAPDPLYEVIPAKPDLTLPQLNSKRNPDFRYRMLPGSPGEAGRDWQRRNRLDLDDRGIARFGFGHNLFNILPPSKYGKTHPEYYAMIDGRRKVPTRDGWDTTNPCLTNPDVIRIAAEAADRYFRENPDHDTFPISINDTADHCHCPTCAKLDAGSPPGQGGVESFADSYFYFVSEVAKRVAQTHPGKYLGCFPYWPVYSLIRHIERLPDNVVIQLTQDTSQQHNPTYRRQERAHWIAWSQKVQPNAIGKYDYYDLGWLTPRTFPHLAAADLKFIQANGCDGFFCGLAPNWSILGPQVYVTTRLLWDASLNPDALLDEYYKTLFGTSAPDMKQFYTLLERYWMQPRPARWFEGLAGITSEFTIINGPLIEEAWQCLEQRDDPKLWSYGHTDHKRIVDIKAHFRFPYLLVKMQAEARALAARKLTTRADLDTLADDILHALALMPEAKAAYASVWQPDPNYNLSYYNSEGMGSRLRDWSYEQHKWLTLAAHNAYRFSRTLPPAERDVAWQAFRQKLLAQNATLDTAGLVRDYRADFDRSDRAINGGKGYSEAQNKGGELAWSESYLLMAYMEMARATRDPDYLRRLVAHFDRILKNRDDALGRTDAYAGKSLAGWGSDAYSDNKWHVWIVHTGMITLGPAAFVRFIKENPAFQAEFGAKAATYRARIAECLRDADPYWQNGPEPDEGHYTDPNLKTLLPLNQQNALGSVLLEMHKATGDPAYRDKAQRLARFFHRRLRYPHSDYSDWAYWPGAQNDGKGSEDISHAGINVRFAAQCAEAEIVFTKADAVRIARTWLQIVRRGDGTWADTIGGEGRGNQYKPYAVGSWLALCPLLPDTVATKLTQEAVHAFAEERPYSTVEMLGIAFLLRCTDTTRTRH